MEIIATMETVARICKIKSKGTSIGSDDTHQPLQNVPRQRQEFFATKLPCKMCPQQKVGTKPYFDKGLDEESSFDV